MGLENAGCLDYEVIRKMGIKVVSTVALLTRIQLGLCGERDLPLIHLESGL